MKRTEWKASIGQPKKNGTYAYAERRVYIDADGIEHVKIGGTWIPLELLREKGRTVDVYYEVTV